MYVGRLGHVICTLSRVRSLLRIVGRLFDYVGPTIALKLGQLVYNRLVAFSVNYVARCSRVVNPRWLTPL